VKPGYKQTEVGVIPEEWEVKPLKRLSPSQSVGLVINPSTYFDKAGTVPLLVGSNVSENAIDSTTSNRITKESNEKLPASRLAAGDLVMVRVGEPGVTAVVPPELDGCNCASMMIVRQHQSFDSHWLCCMMNSRHGRQQVEHVQYGTAQKQFNISDAVDFLYPVPPLPEQRAIAEALSDVDGLLGGLDRLIAKKRDLKQAAMQQLLTGQTRLPGFHGEWEVKRLGDVGKFLKGSGVTKDQTRSGTLACVRYGELYTLHNDVVREFQSWISPEVATTAVRLKQGDILFAGSGETKEEIGKCAAFVSDIEAYAGGDIVIFRPDDSDSVFLGYYLNTGSISRQKASRGQGDAVVHISSSALSDVRCRLSPHPEQTAIASVLSEMDGELAVLEQRREKTRALKQGMMQELLTGRTRLV
jgi:type I restriction enzyme S subunit